MTTRGTGNKNGSKWIRREKRLAIYVRDGLACAYCGFSIEDGASVTLDHIKPRSKGGTHHETNLVTACTRCNASRGDRTVNKFAQSVAQYLNQEIDPKDITRHVHNTTRKTLDVAGAKAIIAARGGWMEALRGA